MKNLLNLRIISKGVICKQSGTWQWLGLLPHLSCQRSLIGLRAAEKGQKEVVQYRLSS